MSDLVNYQEEAYSKLKQMVIHAELMPGATVNKKELEQKLSIGATPLREALIRLQREGLFRVVPQRGTYVAKINLNEVYQARFVRENIEKEVCVEAAQKITPKYLNELKKIIQLQQVYLQMNDFNNFFELDERFHKLFYTIAEKNFIWEWLQPLNFQFDRFRFLRLEVKNLNWEQIIAQHQAIITYTENGDLQQLKQIISKHLHMVDADAKNVVAAFPDYFEDIPEIDK